MLQGFVAKMEQLKDIGSGILNSTCMFVAQQGGAVFRHVVISCHLFQVNRFKPGVIQADFVVIKLLANSHDTRVSATSLSEGKSVSLC